MARQPWGDADAMRAMHWASETLPLSTCVAIWALGSAAATEAAWLAVLHRVLSVLVLLFTGLRLAWRRHVAASSQLTRSPLVQCRTARASLVALYALLAMQPMLSLAGRMLRGERIAVLGGIAVPAVLPVNQPLAHRVFQLQGWNALLLLTLLSLHIAAALHQHLFRRKALPGLPVEGRGPAPAGAAAMGAGVPGQRS